MLTPKDSRDIKKTGKRLMWFLLAVFIFDAFICFLLIKYADMHPAVNGLIIICITGLLYLLFLGICAKIDKNRQERLDKSGKKDPWSKN